MPDARGVRTRERAVWYTEITESDRLLMVQVVNNLSEDEGLPDQVRTDVDSDQSREFLSGAIY
jgi:hypothetical protein